MGSSERVGGQIKFTCLFLQAYKNQLFGMGAPLYRCTLYIYIYIKHLWLGFLFRRCSMQEAPAKKNRTCSAPNRHKTDLNIHADIRKQRKHKTHNKQHCEDKVKGYYTKIKSSMTKNCLIQFSS